MRTLYVFIDESGNFDFSPTGTKHLVLAAVTLLDPIASSSRLQTLKYDLLASGQDIECFHASPDLQAVRNRVFNEIAKLANVSISFAYANKSCAHPSYHSAEAIYALFGKTLLTDVFNGRVAKRCQQIIIVFDKALSKRRQKAFLGIVKPELKAMGKPYHIYFHQTKADFNGQIADYCAWAKYVSLERGELRPLASLKAIPKTNFDIFKAA